MKIKCVNGNSVERFYDRATRTSVTRIIDAAGNQIGDAQFDCNKASAKFAMDMMIKECGGEQIAPRTNANTSTEAP